MTDSLMAVSSIDGRYHGTTKVLADYLSEYALIQARIRVMTYWFLHLTDPAVFDTRPLTDEERVHLNGLCDLSLKDAQVIKQIETKGYGAFARTNHDVKACELWLRLKFEETTLGDLVEWIHFGLTSEDVNNVAYALMLGHALECVLNPALADVENTLQRYAISWGSIPMLARTHGQPASPTTLGKEFAVFKERLSVARRLLENHTFSVKVNGASGNYNALCAVSSFAKVPPSWQSFTQDFIGDVQEMVGVSLQQNPLTTQIEPHDTYAELFHMLMRINTILIGLCQDVWRYVSDDWLVQAVTVGETGSSTMPHKVNPIDFENAEGNLGVANALLSFLASKLPVSRLQRDLSDSTTERVFGTAFGHCLVAYQALLRGLGKISPNELKIADALNSHPEVITEAYQTILRATGFPHAYMALKDLSRGRRITLSDLHAFVQDLDVPEEVKEHMRSITPENYIGVANLLARM